MKTIVRAMALLLLTTGPVFAAKSASYYFSLGTKLYNGKDYEGSYYAFEAGLVMKPNSAPGYQGLGDSLYFRGRQTEALAAYQKSLTLNPNNPKLAAFVKNFTPVDAGSVAVVVGAPTVTSDGRVNVSSQDLGVSPDKVNSAAATVAVKPDLRLAFEKNMWFRGYVGYDFALLGDISGGMNTLTSANNSISTVTGTAQSGSNGILGGIEFGLAVDSGNAFSVCIENIWSQTQSYSNGVTDLSDPNAVYQPSFSPGLTSISVNYYAFIPGDKSSRTYLQFGCGFYQAVVGYTAFNPSTVLSAAGLSPVETGSFSAGGFGGTVGIGETFTLDKSFALDISGRGRIASFSQLTADEISHGGIPTTDGPYAIGIDPGGAIGVVPVNPNIGSSYRYAVLDYSGFDANLSLNYYF